MANMHEASEACRIEADDVQLRKALAVANLPTLILSLVHLTGDTAILHGKFKPSHANLLDQTGGFSEEQSREIRDIAFDVLRGYRETPRPLPVLSSPTIIHKMIDFLAGHEVRSAYHQLAVEEITSPDDDSKDVPWRVSPPPAGLEAFQVAVIGCGISGLLAAIKLRRAGFKFTVFEKNDDIGGTWCENAYPGAGVDVESHLYSYSFIPNRNWPDYFSKRDELKKYLDDCADRFDLLPHVRLHSEVRSVIWDDASSRWRLRVSGFEGESEFEANAIICAVGQLNCPSIPDIPGLDSFAGIARHTARWDRATDLRNKRVAVVGNGASAMQVVPTIAQEVSQLYVFQREPQWMVPNPRYKEKMTAEKNWLLDNIPYYRRWYRLFLFWKTSDGLHESLRLDPNWPHQNRSVNALNDGMRQFLIGHIEQQLADRPDMIQNFIPSYPPFGKRPLIDNGWLRAMTNDNAKVISDPIERLSEHAVIAGGKEYPVDIVVLATGFQPLKLSFKVQGRGGLKLSDAWGEDPSDPRAYLGITMPGFPNFFFMYGPNTNVGSSASVIFNSELQFRYIALCLRELIESGSDSLEVKKDVHDIYNERADSELKQMVWANSGTSSWYKSGPGGRITTNLPFPNIEYWELTRQLNRNDYVWND